MVVGSISRKMCSYYHCIYGISHVRCAHGLVVRWLVVIYIYIYIHIFDILLFIKTVSTGWHIQQGCFTVYPKKYAHGLCFVVATCTLTDFPISIRLTSLPLWQSNDCPSASKATLMNMDKYFMWIHYERLHNHNKAKHNKTVCIFHGIYCTIPHVDGD